MDYKAQSPGDTGGRGSLLNMLDDISVGDPAKLRDMKPIVLRAASLPSIDKGVMDLFGYAAHYIESRYYTKSTRCGGCAVAATCEGLHINTVRAKGYSQLHPLRVSR